MAQFLSFSLEIRDLLDEEVTRYPSGLGGTQKLEDIVPKTQASLLLKECCTKVRRDA